MAIIAAGGGPQHFRTATLFRGLAGPLSGAEFAKLRFQFGRKKVDTFSSVFEFTVADYVKITAREHLAQPPPSPDPHDALALSKAMLHSAAAPGGYSIDVLLDNLLSPDVHAEIDRDLRSAFGPEGDDVYHAILLQALLDMKRANRL